MNKQVLPLYGTRMRSDRSLEVCLLPPARSLQHSPLPTLSAGSPSPPPSPPGVHIWGNPTSYSAVGLTPAPSSPPHTHQPVSPGPGPPVLTPSAVPSSPICPVHHSSLLPDLSPQSNLSLHSPRGDRAQSTSRESPGSLAWPLRISPTRLPHLPSECSPW